jgi:hypothetical protein
MNGNCQSAEPILCDCCEGIAAETPQPITNRPALKSIAYRAGTQSQFKASMLAELSAPENQQLQLLRTRADSDFAIGLIDAWAVTADILTFYNERIANEAYLRTALERRSVFELARLVGYRPSPGVSASAYIAFTLNDAPGSPDDVMIPAGTRIQSVPGPGQTPAMFETSNDITAVISSNAIPAQRTIPWALTAGDIAATFQGTALKVNPGDGILFIDAQLRSTLATGVADFHFVTSTQVDSVAGTTRIHWDFALSSGFGENNAGVFVYIFRKRAALFGVQSPDPKAVAQNNTYYTQKRKGDDWDFSYKAGSFQVNLDATYPGVSPAPDGEPQWVTFVSPGGIGLYTIRAATETGLLKYALSTKTTHLTLSFGLVLLDTAVFLRLLAAILDFDNYVRLVVNGATPAELGAAFVDLQNAIVAYLAALPNMLTPDQLLKLSVAQTRSTTVFVQSELLPPADPQFTGPWPLYPRQDGMLKPVAGPNLEITGGQRLASGQPVAVSGKRVRLQIAQGSSATFVPSGSTGALAVADKQTFLVDAFPPRSQRWQVITTNGIAGVLNTPDSNIVLMPAEKADLIVSESAVISTTTVAGPVTILQFDGPLNRIYDRSSVTVNANTVMATHGETVHEILGNGDASNAALQFTLKQSPLTYVSAATSNGSQSTLQVWVNNLQWHESENFLDSSPSDRAFVTRMGDKQNVTLQFGDGTEGARTPTGQMNVRAVFRKGIGSPGMVRAGQLSQPIDRPQGLKSATNPDPASGGADPATADDARASAPLHVLTLDRVVSLEDYWNYARAFSGIAKVLATWTWFGYTRGVFLTVAGANGATFHPGDPTILNLAKSIAGAGNPFVPLMVQSYTPVMFEIAASVRIDSVNYAADEVRARVWQALSMTFSFAQRDLGQGVAQSEIVAIIQNTAGVVAVEITAFQRSGDAPVTPLPTVLRAASPAAGGNTTPQAAEMLLLDPASRGNIGAWS